jgi:chromosome segregation ATPase
MSIVVLFIVALSAVSSLVIAKSIIKMRKKLINAEESKQRLKAGLQIRLTAEEKNRRHLEEKLLNVEEERTRIEEEIKVEIKEKEALKKVLNEKMNQLVTECQQLREILSKTQNEYQPLEEEVKLGVKQEELEPLGDELQNLREKLSESKEKRKRLVNRLRAIKPIDRGGRSRGSVKEKGGNGLEERSRSLKPELICWKEGPAWIIGVEVPEELESQGISQDGQG